MKSLRYFILISFLISSFTTIKAQEDTQYLRVTYTHSLLDAPSYSANALATVEEGTILSIIDKEGEFYKVNYEDKIGYLKSSFIIFVDFDGNGITDRKNYNSDASSNTAETSTGRCQATTKAGTQCKRNAETGSNYCWQHNKSKSTNFEKKSESTYTDSKGRTIYTGPRGGQYYINSKGKKTYIKKK